MAISVTWAGNSYTIPQQGDASAWGTNLTAYLQALASPGYLISPTGANALTGYLRLANSDKVSWRNAAGSADLQLGVGSANQLQWAGADVTGNPQAIYYTTAGQSIAASTTSVVNYGTQELDTNSSVVTGASWVFTVPAGKAGLYVVQAALAWNAALTGTASLYVYKNGTAVRTLSKVVNPAAGQMQMGTTVLSLAATDTVQVKVNQTSAGAVALSAVATENYVSIFRQVS